jgi:hypothetical protein
MTTLQKMSVTYHNGNVVHNATLTSVQAVMALQLTLHDAFGDESRIARCSVTARLLNSDSGASEALKYCVNFGIRWKFLAWVCVGP